MESRIFVIKNAKDVKKTKESIMEKAKSLVSADVTMQEEMMIIKKKSSWTESEGTITFNKKGKDLEMTMITKHSATGLAVGAGCILMLFGLILVVVPWYLYDQEKKSFDNGLVNVLNYAVQQG